MLLLWVSEIDYAKLGVRSREQSMQSMHCELCASVPVLHAYVWSSRVSFIQPFKRQLPR